MGNAVANSERPSTVPLSTSKDMPKIKHSMAISNTCDRAAKGSSSWRANR